MEEYLLTGGPGSGKSSIILYLEAYCGEHIIREAAEDRIRLRQAMGVSAPWTEKEHQNKIIDLQKLRKGRVHPDAARVFIDRDIPDGLAYNGPETEVYQRLVSESSAQKYKKVFLVELLDETQNSNYRPENREEAERLGAKMKEIYSGLGCEIVRVPAGALEERAKVILENL